MDGVDAIHGEDIAGRGPRELVSTMTGPAGNGEGIDTRIGDELRRLFGVRQQLIVTQFARCADAVFFARLTRLQ